MARRDELVPEDLVAHLCRAIPGFRDEDFEHQHALARMVWIGSMRRRRHNIYEDAMSFGHEELARAFGRDGFHVINDRLDFFSVSSNYIAGKSTRAYRFSDQVQKARKAYLSRYWRGVTKLLNASGQALKTIPASVASTDSRGNPVRPEIWSRAESLNRVMVDMETLTKLRRWLQGIGDQWQQDGAPPVDLVTDFPGQEVIERLRDISGQVVRMARTDLAGKGYIAQRYTVSPSGRLYAKDINLQTAPTLVKQAALNGLWEYDFSNCHFAILMQMAATHGHQCKAIKHYLANKPKVRQALATAAGITIPQIKECLLALIYGARASSRDEDAIPEAIGVEAAQRLYQEQLFQDIKDDILSARRTILANYPRTPNGSFSNARNRAISGAEKPARILAHLIQGAEAAALLAAFNLHPNDIVLLQHDGFVAHRRLNAKAAYSADRDRRFRHRDRSFR
jgi:hypothetical protein